MMETETTLLPSYQDLADALKDGMTPTAQEKILELRQLFLSMQEENGRLRERVKLLEAAAKSPANKLIFDKGVYWSMEGIEREGPFCPACQDKDSKLVRLHYCQTGTPGVYWICKSCLQSF